MADAPSLRDRLAAGASPLSSRGEHDKVLERARRIGAFNTKSQDYVSQVADLRRMHRDLVALHESTLTRYTKEQLKVQDEEHDRFMKNWLGGNIRETSDQKMIGGTPGQHPGFKLQRTDTSRLNDVIKTLFRDLGLDRWSEHVINQGMWQSILINHDWHALIKDSPDFKSGEWKPPFDTCAFEFTITGVHIVAFLDDHNGELTLRKNIRCRRHDWIHSDVFRVAAHGLIPYHSEALPPDDLDRFLFDHIKAACIMLDAEVAELTEPQRAPYKRNESRPDDGSKLPEFSYRVVSLARRARAQRLPDAGGDERPKRHHRLHFRRGHWRHFEDHKTWIKWMLVGDPDLGFIDKDYQL